MNKPLATRIELLESEQRPGEPKSGFYLHELGFIPWVHNHWPEPDTAPAFIQAELNRISRRPGK